MFYLLDFFRKNSYLLLFLVLETVSFILLFRFNHYQGSVWLSSANEVAAGVQNLYTGIERYTALGQVNERLTSENLRLQMENARLRKALTQATHDSTLTERLLADHLGDHDGAAHLIGGDDALRQLDDTFPRQIQKIPRLDQAFARGFKKAEFHAAHIARSNDAHKPGVFLEESARRGHRLYRWVRQF